MSGNKGLLMSFRKFEQDEELILFVREHTDLFAADDELTVSEIGDGNINFVYRIAAANGPSVIVKQALPYVRIIGEGWPLSQDRVRIEAESLLIAGKYCPDLVPHVYHFDAELCAIVMEDIGAQENLRHLLVERRRLPLLGEHLGRFLASTLFYTSDFYLDAYEKKEQVRGFINPDLCKITEDLFFMDPYCDHERNNINDFVREQAEALWDDEVLKREVAKLKARFLSQPEVLLHGDLHSGSVFASDTGTKVIDPEFAFCGPAAFDVGSIIGNLFLNFAGQSQQTGEQEERTAYQQWLLETAETVWTTFAEQFRALVSEHGTEPTLCQKAYLGWYLDQVFQDTLGYAGTEMIRRTIGLAHVADIETIEDLEKRAEAEKLSLAIGHALIVQRGEFETIRALKEFIESRYFSK